MRAFVHGRVHTISGQTIERGTVLVDDRGRIADIGEDLELAPDTERIDCGGYVVMPGLIDAHTHVGIGEDALGWEGRDYNESSDPVTPHLRAIDGINPADLGLKDALESGITTVLTGPGSANVIGGQSVVIRTRGRTVDRMVIREPAGMKAALGENPKRVYGRGKDKSPVTRMGSAAILRTSLSRAREYLEKKERAGDDPEKRPDLDLKLEALCPVLKGEIPLRVHAHRADDLMTALRIAREFAIDLTLEHCTEGHRIADALKEAGVPAVIGPSLTSRSKIELRERTFETAAVLQEMGVQVALMTDHPVIPLQYLPVVAALAVKAGLPYDDALRAVTLNAAAILGVDDRLGSLERGKDADLVVFNGDPLDIMTRVEMVVIGGEPVYRSDSREG